MFPVVVRDFAYGDIALMTQGGRLLSANGEYLVRPELLSALAPPCFVEIVNAADPRSCDVAALQI